MALRDRTIEFEVTLSDATAILKPVQSPPPARGGLRVAFWRLIFSTPFVDQILKKRAARLIEQSGIRKHLKPGGVYLDIGSGSGHFVERIIRQESETGVKYIAFDPAWKPTGYVLDRLRKRNPGRALFLLADGLTLPVAGASFDGVSLCFVLHHVPYEGQGAILKEIRRVLKPGGRIFLIEDTPDHKDEWPTHVKRDRKLNFEPGDEPHFYRSGPEWREYLGSHGIAVLEENYFEECSGQPIPIRHRGFVLQVAG